QLSVDDRHLGGPAREEWVAALMGVSVGMDRVDPGVGRLQRGAGYVVARAPALGLELVDPLSELVEEIERGAVGGRRVPATVLAGAVLLVRPDDDLWLAVAVQVGDGRRIHDRPLLEGPGARVERDLVRLRIDR